MLSKVINELEKQSKKRDVLLLLSDCKLKVIDDPLELTDKNNNSIRYYFKQCANALQNETTNIREQNKLLKEEIDSLKLENEKLTKSILAIAKALEATNAKIENIKTEVL